MIEIKIKKRGKGKLMKTKKIIVLLSAITFLTTAPFSVQAKNCTGFKMLSHKWIMCQTGSNKYEAVFISDTHKEFSYAFLLLHKDLPL